MSCILYYSNFCQHSKLMLQKLAQSPLKKDIHFVCIDKRAIKNNKTYLILENGQDLILPSNITRVPALLLLSNYSAVFGEEIYEYFKPKEEVHVREATQNNMEPLAFSMNGLNNYGIFSDQFSFFDMDASELAAKGEGGMRQLHNYIPLNDMTQQAIYTPEDGGNQSKIENTKLKNEMTVERIQQLRENDLKNV